MLRSIGKQSGESAESVLKKKRKATVGRICRKKGFKPGMKSEGGGDGILIMMSMNVSSITICAAHFSHFRWPQDLVD